MKHLIPILILICYSCNFNYTDTDSVNDSDIKQDTEKIKSIKNTLIKQRDCWNNGDIDGFMQGYWNSDKLVFTSLAHKPAYGWENTIKRYKTSYPDRKSMGNLQFNIIDVKLISDSSAKLTGEWQLIRQNDNPYGKFWLEIRLFNDTWLITKDSTISLTRPIPVPR